MDSKFKRFWILIFILIIAGFLRTYQIKTIPPGLYPDEAMNGNNALEALSPSPTASGFKVFYPENNGREGLFINIQALFLKFFGLNEPWVLRLPNAIFGILTVLGVYFLAKELFSANIGLLSAFLLTTNFWHINFSRIGFRANTAPFYLVWGVYFLIIALKKFGSSKKITGPLILAVLAGAAYGLGFHSYIAYRATPLLIALILIFYLRKSIKENWRGRFWLNVFVFALIAFFAILPLLFYFIKTPGSFFGRTTQVSIFNSPTPIKDLSLNILKTAAMFNFAGDANWRHNYSGRPELFWPVGIMFLIGVVLSIRELFKKEAVREKLGSIILLAWLIVAALPVVVSNEGIPHALRSILMIPPIFILAGIGGINAYTYLREHSKIKWLPTLAFLLLVFVALRAYQDYFISWAQNPNVRGAFSADYVDLGEKLNALQKETPKYVVVETGGVSVRGLPMPTQTTMFITDTFLPEKQLLKNIHYVLPDQEANIPSGALKFYIR